MSDWQKFLRKNFENFLGGVLGSGRNDGLGRDAHARSGLDSTTDGQMKPTPQEAVKIWKSLKPKKREDMRYQWVTMSSGSNGPFVPGTHSGIRVRQHYYPTWTNEDFKWVVSQIDELEG